MLNFLRTNKSSVLLAVATLAAAIGFGDSLYLTFSHYGESAVVCSLLDGCNVVLSSPWAVMFGIPLALFGTAYYGFMLIILIGYGFSKQVVLKKILLAVSTIGFILSLWFLYVQIGIIGSLCEYCLLSLVSTLCVWISVMVMNRPAGDIIENN